MTQQHSKQSPGRCTSWRLRNLVRNLIDLGRDGGGWRETEAELAEVREKYRQLLILGVESDLVPRPDLVQRHFPLWADYVFQQVVNARPPLPPEFDEEVAYLREAGKAGVFPYPQVRTGAPVTAACDEANGLSFVLHQGRKLYFPKEWSLKKTASAYRRYLEVENILGGGYTRKAPHQYQAENFRVQAGDVVVDAGAAEGLFALDVIDLARRVYVIESGAEWRAPLQATLAPFGDKAVLIPQTVAATDGPGRMRLATLLEQEPAPSWFIKMDIEGDEVAVLEELVPRLPAGVAWRFACAVYHREQGAEQIQALFARHGFQTEFSDGYMLYLYDPDLQYPYFRRGVLRAFRGA